MSVSVRAIDSSIERSIGISMVTDERFLAGVEEFWRPELASEWLRVLADWCMSYHKRYQKAPGAIVQDLFESWCRRDQASKETQKIMAKFLDSISHEYERQERQNTDYDLDKAAQLMKELALKNLSQDIDACIGTGSTEEAEKILSEFRVPMRLGRRGKNPFMDSAGWKHAFEQIEEPLFYLPGALGEMIGSINRDELGAFMGPEKRGKTWWLLLTALKALEARCHVAYFQLGDLSEPQVYMRIGVYLTCRHYKTRYCGRIRMPVLDCDHNQTGNCSLPARRGIGAIKTAGTSELPSFDAHTSHIICHEDGCKTFRGAIWWTVREPIVPLDWRSAESAAKSYLKKQCFSEDRLRLSTHPNKSVSVKDLERHLDMWEREDGFVPDVIVADYADILAPLDGRIEFRHQQDETWSALRRLSQERHCAVITATQADAKSYEAAHVREKHFTEDKRKYGHVNIGMITLNQSANEKKAGIMRLGRLFVREDDYDVREEVTALQCLDIGRPYVGGWRNR